MLFSFVKVSQWFQYKAAGIWGVKSSSSYLELTQLANRAQSSAAALPPAHKSCNSYRSSLNRWENEVPGHQTERSFLVITLTEYQDLWQVALSP